MANSEEREKYIENENSNTRRPRPHNQSHRPPYTSRGRGRHDPHVAKAMLNFGVTDLRELLDRKHHEIQISVVHSRSRSTERQPLFQRHDYRSKSTERTPENGKATLIHGVDNIQIELTTSTGHRNLRIDQDKKLGNLVHVPDHEFSDQHAFARGRGRANWRGQGGPARGRGGEVRGRGGYFRARGEFRGRGGDLRGRGGELRGRGGEFRGRGGEFRGRGGEFRGRGRSNDNSNMSDHDNLGSGHNDNSIPGRGRGNYRGRRGQARGRSQRGNRSMGQTVSREDYKADLVSSTILAQNEVVSEENWDDESFSTPAATEQNEVENCSDRLGTIDHDEFDNCDAHNKDNYLNPTAEGPSENYEDESETILNKEDNLIITYPTEDDSNNRVVRLSVPHSEEPEELNQYLSDGNRENNEDKALKIDSSDVDHVSLETESSSKGESEIMNDLARLEIKTHQDDKVDRSVPVSTENVST